MAQGVKALVANPANLGGILKISCECLPSELHKARVPEHSM